MPDETPKKSKKRKPFVIFLAVFLVMAGLLSLFLVLTADDPPPKDDDMAVPKWEEIPASQNAYAVMGKIVGAIVTPPGGTGEEIRDLSFELEELWTTSKSELFEKNLLDRAARLLKDNDAALQLIDDMLARPKYQSPRVDSFSSLVPQITWSRSIGDVIVLRALHRFRSGEEKEAFDDTLGLLELSHQMAHGAESIIEHMVGRALYARSLTMLHNFWNETTLPPAEQRRVLDEFRKFPVSTEGLVLALKHEYRVVASTLDQLGEGDLDPMVNDFGGSLRFSRFTFKKNKTKRKFLESHRSYIRALRGTFAERQLADFQPEQPDGVMDWIQLALGGNFVGESMTAMLAISFAGFIDQQYNFVALDRTTLCMLAAKCFHNDHGRLPRNLDELVPEYIGEVPVDPYDGRPLRYSSNPGVVYSVGSDLKDGGGQSIDGLSDRTEPSAVIELGKGGEKPPQD